MIGHIFKYELPVIGERFELNLPKDCAICDIQPQGESICMWAMVDIHAELETHAYMIVGTGWKLDDAENMYYVKTVVMPSGLVWHVFEVK